MEQFEAGTLKTGHGQLVTSERQAKAIAANVASKDRSPETPRTALSTGRDKRFFFTVGTQ